MNRIAVMEALSELDHMLRVGDEERANKLKRSIELNELEYPYDLKKYLHPPVPPMDGDFEEVE